MEYDNIVVKHVSLFSRTRVGNVTETCWIWIPDIDRWYPPLLLWTLKHPRIISAIRHQRIAPSWFGFYSHVSCLSMHLVAARCTGHKKIPQQPSPSLSFQTLVTHNKETHSSISLSGAIHHVMKSFFLGALLAGTVEIRYQWSSQAVLSTVLVVWWSSVTVAKSKIITTGVFFPPLSHFPPLLASPFLSLSSPRSLALCNFSTAEKVPELPKQLDKYRPRDEFHGGSWQRWAEAEVPVSICTELSQSDIVIQRVIEAMVTCGGPCFSGKAFRETTRRPRQNLFGRLLRNTVMTLWFICEADGPCYWMGLSPSLNVSIIYMC